ncbi:epithelial cell-transforming sequence 2 oncogene-like isoform X6 [Castor canadensis]|uniref:Epithelial cell-transforming sequence 2 oncogene-like isoform X6 n=1 Tax=Castor canadensis TaxID=51338 RepID=A0AC58MJF8_CASCN
MLLPRSGRKYFPEMSVGDSSQKTLEMESFHTRFSAWTPFSNKSLNRQLFQERVALISHWFDLWTNKQRQEFLFTIFLRCTKSQLRFVQDWFSERKQVARVDFSTILPRFISLYIFSFLNPKDLCAAAQVSWPWKFLTEQDCLWMPKCIKFGWLLPYTPADKEYGAWKNHYIACVSSLEWLTPREAAATYGTLNEPKTEDEELQERRREKCLRKILWEKIALRKKELFRVRPPWMSGTCCPRRLKSKGQPWLSQMGTEPVGLGEVLERQLVLESLEALPKRSSVSGSHCYPLLSKSDQHGVYKSNDSSSNAYQLHMILISTRIPAYEMVMESVKAGVVAVVYEHSGVTLESLLWLTERALQGRKAQSVGIFSDGDSREINLLQGYKIGIKNLLKPEVRDFWEKLGSHVATEEEGGHVDLFVPLGASGQFLFDSMSLANILNNQEISQALADGLMELSKKDSDKPLEFLSSFLLKKCNKKRKDFEDVPLTEHDSKETLDSFIKGRNHAAWDTKPHLSRSDRNVEALVELERKLQRGPAEGRTRAARELLESERKFVQQLEILSNVYVRPLRAALSSNRAILSAANIQVIFSDILRILSLNRQFLDNLRDRLQEWGPAHCIGEIFTKFGSQLNIYTNFFNNYPVVLKTIEKCRDTTPAFRAFLKRHDKTIVTNMLSLPELLLCPSRRFEEYLHLLYALRLHTPVGHGDREDLTTAIDQMKKYKGHIDQMKENIKMKEQLSDIERTIWGCPTLSEVNRYLIRVQDVAQLHCCDEEVSFYLRLYEQIRDLSLFLFNDALLVCSRGISHTPFERTSTTTYQFIASVALSRLLIEDIPDSKYVKNAFILQGPKCEWICATEAEDDKLLWLSVLQSTIRSSMEK